MPDRSIPTAASSVPDPSSTARSPHGAGARPEAATKPGGATNSGADRDRSSRPGRSTESTPDQEATAGWPPRDMLAPFVLLAVSLQRAHGYVIEDYLRALGLFGVTMSTLYRTLRQMEKDGFLESAWEPGPTGPARRVYTITDAGHAWLDSSAAMLKAYSATIDRFFGLYGAGAGATGPGPEKPTDEKEPPG